ncbi:hypothetical protein ACFU7Y_02870 [Kitasatospora sp. NPDC057542]|uniref:hypothetical protein n=1 Tax=Kitasatospora sp. NPDC057542 TaxID=3346162 RepID=UPI0036CD9896
MRQIKVGRILTRSTDDRMERLADRLAEDASSVADLPAQDVVRPLACARCQSDEQHIVQGRPGEEITLVCRWCGQVWTPEWRGGGDAAEANQTLLEQAIAEAETKAGSGAGATDILQVLLDGLTAGEWTPTDADRLTATQLLSELPPEEVTESVISGCMRATLPYGSRSEQFGEALARTIGVLVAPGLDGSYGRRMLALLTELARTITAVHPDDLPARPAPTASA